MQIFSLCLLMKKIFIIDIMATIFHTLIECQANICQGYY